MEHAHNVGEGADRAALARTIMRRQAVLGLRVAAVFVLILVGLPLLNLFAPDAMASPVGGFSLGWLLLAVLFYPVTWLLSWAFVRGSDRIEAAIVADVRSGKLQGLGAAPASPLASPAVTEPVPDAVPTKRKLFVDEGEEEA